MLKLLLVSLLTCAALVASERDVSGTWDFTVETAAGSGTPSFVFTQKGEALTGTYNGLFGKADVSGTVKGDQIEFGFAFEYSGQSGKAHYFGKIESGSKMSGKVEYEGLGEGTWTAAKQK